MFIEFICCLMGRIFGPAFKMVNDAKAHAPAPKPPTGQVDAAPVPPIYRPSNRSA